VHDGSPTGLRQAISPPSVQHAHAAGAGGAAEPLPPLPEAVYAAVPAGLFVFDADGRVLTANPAGRALVGAPGTGPAPGAVLDRLDPAARAAFQAHLGAVLAAGTPGEHALHLAPEGGLARDLLVRSAPFGGSERCCSVVLDHTEYRAREVAGAAALARTEAQLQARGTFLARLGHELRSALASMVGFAELLRQHGDAESRELADLIRLSGRHLLDTLRAVLDLARLEAQEEPLTRSRVDVVARVREWVAVMRPLARARGLALEWRPEVEEACALLNPTFLDRIVHNLIDNAIKYTREGQVEVRVARRDGQVWIYVTDTGIGIDARFLPRVFGAFEREHARTEGIEGVGLGLAITRSLVEHMGGRIYAASARGAGSTFTVHFPLARG
jgi:signal transduction histidine kinase